MMPTGFRYSAQTSRQALVKPEGGLDRLITIGIAGKHHQLAFQDGFSNACRRQNCRATFEDDLRLEIGSGSESPILMRRAGVTVGAGVKTTPVGIHAPSKREVRAVIPAKNLLCIVFEQLDRARAAGSKASR